MTVNAFGFSDAARRCAESVNLAVLAGGWGKWVAVRLSDGGSDGNIYDKRADAIRHQLHEKQCCYIMVPFVPMTPGEAEAFMKVNRELYDKGMRLADPDGKDAYIGLRRELI